MIDKGNPTVIHIFCVITLIIEDVLCSNNSKTIKWEKCLTFSKIILLIIGFRIHITIIKQINLKKINLVAYLKLNF